MDCTPASGARRAPARLVIATLMASVLLAVPALGQDDDRSLRAYFTANGLLNRGLFEEAAAEYESFLADDPRGAEAATARYGLAVALTQLGRVDDALGHLDDLGSPTNFPFRFESDFLKAQLRYGQSEFGDAAQVAARLVRRSPDHPQAHDAAGLWIECLHRAGDHTEAAQRAGDVLGRDEFQDRDLDRAALFGGLSLSTLGKDEDAARLLRPVSRRDDELGHSAAISLAGVLTRLGQSDQAAALYQRLAALDDPRWSAQALLGSARIRRAGGAHDSAISLLERLEQRYADSSVSTEAQLELGINLIESGRLDEGRDALPELDEDDNPVLASRAAYWQAKAELREGRAKEAASGLEQAIESFSDSPVVPEMRYDLGVALAESGEQRRAIEVFEQVRRDHPDHRLADAARLAEATTLLAIGEYANARQAASRVDDDALQAPDADLVIAESDALLGEHGDAVDRLEAWLDAYPDHPSVDRATYRLSMSLASLGRLDDAERTAAAILSEQTLPDDFGPGLVVLGDASFRDEDWKRAEQWYARAVEAEVAPLGAAQLKLGLALARQGRHEEAIPLFEAASGDGSDETSAIQAVFESGQAFLLTGQDDRATGAFEGLLDRAPESRFAPYAMRQLGSLAERAGDPVNAADWYRRAAASGGDTASGARRDQARAALAGGRYDTVAGLAAEWDDPDLVAYAGIAAARQGDPERALRTLEAVLREGGLSKGVRSAAVLEKAWCERRLGNDRDAMRSLMTLLEDSGPDRHAIYAALEAAAIELDAQRLEQASGWLDRAQDMLQATPALSEHAMRAQLDYRLAQLARARGDDERVVALLASFNQQHPDTELRGPAALLLGDALIETRQPGQAADAFQRASDLAQGDLREAAMLRLGDALAQADRWSASREVYEMFLSEFADSAFDFEAEFGLAWALEHEGELEQAREIYARVIETHRGPTAARAQFQIGECLFAEGRLDEAVRELMRVDILYDYPEWSAAALYEAGRAFEQLRKFGEARQQYREVVTRFGDSTWATLASDRLTSLASGN